MRIDIITVLPEMFDSPLNCSILQRAQKKGLVEFHIHNLRDYTTNKHRKVDDYPFGGEAGMVMQVEPIDRCISTLKAERDYDEVIFTSPDGEIFDQPMANSMSLLNNIIILCGHYKGVDYRVREHLITKEISIGDYVLTGDDWRARRTFADEIGRNCYYLDIHKKDFVPVYYQKGDSHGIPYRCLYSRNVENLFMAGSDISVTHVVLGTVRVMRTCGMMGEVVGMAAALCQRRGLTPRGVYERGLGDLKALMDKGVGKPGDWVPQRYNLG